MWCLQQQDKKKQQVGLGFSGLEKLISYNSHSKTPRLAT